jgi:hypothetical protein
MFGYPVPTNDDLSPRSQHASSIFTCSILMRWSTPSSACRLSPDDKAPVRVSSWVTKQNNNTVIAITVSISDTIYGHGQDQTRTDYCCGQAVDRAWSAMQIQSCCASACRKTDGQARCLLVLISPMDSVSHSGNSIHGAANSRICVKR